MATPRSASGAVRPHGRLLAGEAGALAGVSGTTIGQWARRGYIPSSQSDPDDEPRVYSVEDVVEAAIVAQLFERGVSHADVLSAIERLGGYGRWPLSEAELATTVEQGRPRIALREDEEWLVLGRRGWQASAEPRQAVPGRIFDEVRLRLRREPA